MSDTSKRPQMPSRPGGNQGNKQPQKQSPARPGAPKQPQKQEERSALDMFSAGELDDDVVVSKTPKTNPVTPKPQTPAKPAAPKKEALDFDFDFEDEVPAKEEPLVIEEETTIIDPWDEELPEPEEVEEVQAPKYDPPREAKINPSTGTDTPILHPEGREVESKKLSRNTPPPPQPEVKQESTQERAWANKTATMPPPEPQKQYTPQASTQQNRQTPPAPKPVTKQNNVKATPEQAKRFFKPASEERKANKSMSPRTQANIIRVTVVGGIVALAGLGIYNTFITPTTVPGTEELVAAMQAETGVYNFPTSDAEAFIKGYTRAYFTKPAEMSQGDYKANLDQYSSSASGNTGLQFTGENGVSIAEGPYVSSIRYVDNNLASYTMQVKLNGDTRYTFLEVALYYNSESDAFTIMGTPGIVPTPPLSEQPEGYNSTWNNDQELADSLNERLESFFVAWAASNETDLEAFLDPEATEEVRKGLEGEVTLRSITDIQAEYIEGDDTGQRDRTASAVITWDTPNGYSYTSKYELRISYDGTRWNVVDIRAGIFN